MRTPLLSLTAFILLLCIAACGGSKDEDEKPHVPMPVKYTVLQKSSFLNEKNISMTIDSLDNTLLFCFRIQKMSSLPFPVVKQYRDTLHKTAFTFDLYQDGKIVRSDFPLMKNTIRWYDDTLETAMNMRIVSDTINLMTENEIRFSIPMYALHDLKKGKQSFELAFSQDVFVDEVYVKEKEGSDYVHLSESKPLLNGRIKFDINLPPIYKTEVYGLGLVLRNDSVFSPAGMDNTIFQSSYPDIYWCIFYPMDVCYVQTPYEKSTDRYEAHDTFSLYHYYTDDSLGIGVYDHDNLSRDDGLGFWKGSLEELSKAKYNKVLRFGAIDHFDLKVKSMGVVN